MAQAEHVLSLTLDPTFQKMLARQDDLQAFLLGRRPIDLDDDEKAAFLRNMALALNAEVTEVLEETNWKPWATRPDGQGVVRNLPAYTSELADVYIFFMNLMLLGGVSTMDLAKAVQGKQEKNLARWTSGYDAFTNKCRYCRRSFDDDGVTCYPAKDTAGILAFCAVSGRFLDKDGDLV